MHFPQDRIFSCVKDWLYPRYSLVNRLQGHQGAITKLCVSENGILASGGYDGIKLWQLPAGLRLNAPTGGQALRGPVSALAWARLGDTEVLFYGTAGGYLSVWRELDNPVRFRSIFSKRVGNHGEISSIDVLPLQDDENVVATSSVDGVVQVWAMDNRGKIWCTLTVQFDPGQCLRSVRLSLDGRMRVFNMHSGEMITLDRETGEVQSVVRIGGIMMSSIAFSPGDQYIVVDNGEDGVDLFKFPDAEWVSHLSPGTRSVPLSIQLVFGEEGTVIVNGGDHGIVRVIRLSDGKMICRVRHESRSSILSVATHHTENAFFIIAGDSHPGAPGIINVWQHCTKTESSSRFDTTMVLQAVKYLVSGVESAARLVLVMLAIVHAVRFLSPIGNRANETDLTQGTLPAAPSSLRQLIVAPIANYLQSVAQDSRDDPIEVSVRVPPGNVERVISVRIDTKQATSSPSEVDE